MELNPLVSPNIGLIFWTALIFILLLVVLRAFAWKPILGALADREKSIADALSAAERAAQQAGEVSAQNEAQLREGREQVNRMLAEAKHLREKMMADAKADADATTRRELEAARAAIVAEKNAALAEVKNLAATLAVEIAEKIMKQQFQEPDQQEAFARQTLQEAS
jgi:F-type H+-transporting ATPase subunit b